MELLAQLLGSLTGQPSGGQRGNALLDIATTLIQGHPGGLAGLVQQFTDAGLGREASSWVSTGQNLTYSGAPVIFNYAGGSFSGTGAVMFSSIRVVLQTDLTVSETMFPSP